MAVNVSLDSVLERALAESGAVSPQDAILVALHATLLSTGFVCVAIGDQGFGKEQAHGAEAVSTLHKAHLPPGWNGSQDVCSLQYRHVASEQTCLVKAIPLGAQQLISAVVNSQMDNVISLTLTPSKYVKDGSSYDSPSIFVNLLELMSILKGEIEVKLTQVCDKLKSTTTDSQVSVQSQSAPSLAAGRLSDQHIPSPNDPLRVGPSSRPDHQRAPRVDDPLRIGPPRRPIGDPDPFGQLGPFGYGDRDRLPHSGGGMIFDPFRQGRSGGMPEFGPSRGSPFPPGHPPGARFDPVSPLAPPFRPPSRPPGQPRPRRDLYGPDPDHLPPPGYDDMFS